jgi:hypothetical protein
MVGAVLVGAAMVGCAGRPTVIPPDDPALRKTAAQFAADAAKRAYPADAPRAGDAIGRAQVGYMLNVLEIGNLSDEDWTDVEIWVNKTYVVFVSKIAKAPNGQGEIKRIPFQMLYDREGHSFPLDNSKVLVTTVEMLRNGKLYNIPVQMAD